VRTASTHPGLIALLGLALFFVAPVTPAGAAGWASVHRYVHKTGNCGGSREVVASTYGSGHRTANGERFNPQGLTAALTTTRLAASSACEIRTTAGCARCGSTIAARTAPHVAWARSSTSRPALRVVSACGGRNTSARHEAKLRPPLTLLPMDRVTDRA
jgi:hypothetical protein